MMRFVLALLALFSASAACAQVVVTQPNSTIPRSGPVIACIGDSE